jgi:plastocyanin
MFFLRSVSVSLSAGSAVKPQWSYREFSNLTNTITYPPSNIAILTSTASTPLPTAAKQTVEIVVGSAGTLSFNPNSLSVTRGTILRFDFLSLNHTLTQSSLDYPCLSSGKFDTGYRQFNPSNVSGKYLVDYEVQTEEPQWFYCAQDAPRSHCRSGMLFSLNTVNLLDRLNETLKMPASHPLITSPPGSCTTPHNTSSSTSSVPTYPISSWNSPRPNATSIVPEISNSASRLGYRLLFAFSGIVLFLANISVV